MFNKSEILDFNLIDDIIYIIEYEYCEIFLSEHSLDDFIISKYDEMVYNESIQNNFNTYTNEIIVLFFIFCIILYYIYCTLYDKFKCSKNRKKNINNNLKKESKPNVTSDNKNIQEQKTNKKKNKKSNTKNKIKQDINKDNSNVIIKNVKVNKNKKNKIKVILKPKNIIIQDIIITKDNIKNDIKEDVIEESHKLIYPKYSFNEPLLTDEELYMIFKNRRYSIHIETPISENVITRGLNEFELTESELL